MTKKILKKCVLDHVKDMIISPAIDKEFNIAETITREG